MMFCFPNMFGILLIRKTICRLDGSTNFIFNIGIFGISRLRRVYVGLGEDFYMLEVILDHILCQVLEMVKILLFGMIGGIPLVY